MNNVVKTIRSILDKTILSFCGFALILLVVTVTWQVFSRYVLNNPSSFTDELSRYTMVWLGLLGSAYLFGKQKHLSITLLPSKLSPKLNTILQTFIQVLILTFVILALFKGGLSLVGRTMQQFSPALQIPMAYVYMILPISAAVIVVYIVLNLFDAYLKKD